MIECSMKQLYVSLIWPHLEYAASLWDPHLQKDVNMLENVQMFYHEDHNSQMGQRLLHSSYKWLIYHLYRIVGYILNYI